MNKIIGLMVCTMIITLLGGCSNAPPTSYGAAMWASESPDIWFEVKDMENTASRVPIAEGELTLDDNTIPFQVSFGHPADYIVFEEYIKVAEDDGSMAYPNADYIPHDGWYITNILFAGEPKYSSKKMVITVDKKRDNVFNGEVDKIEFIRYDLEETD